MAGWEAWSTGFDGITVEAYGRDGTNALADIQAIGIEFAHLIAQARRTAQALNIGLLRAMDVPHRQAHGVGADPQQGLLRRRVPVVEAPPARPPTAPARRWGAPAT